MTADHDESLTPSLDEWIESEGEAAVLAAVKETKRRVAEGSLPMFSDAADLLRYLGRGHRQTA